MKGVEVFRFKKVDENHVRESFGRKWNTDVAGGSTKKEEEEESEGWEKLLVLDEDDSDDDEIPTGTWR